MATKEEWTEKFEADEGRKPSMDEFLAAKKNNFKRDFVQKEQAAEFQTPSQAVSSDKEKWVENFVSQNNRKPTLEEFTAAKAEGFKRLTIDSLKPRESTSDQITGSKRDSSLASDSGPTSEKSENENFEREGSQSFAERNEKESSQSEAQSKEAAASPQTPAEQQGYDWTSREAQEEIKRELMSQSDTPQTPSAEGSQMAWLADFQEKFGRKPTADEFKRAKASHFASVENGATAPVQEGKVPVQPVQPEKEAASQSKKSKKKIKKWKIITAALAILLVIGGGVTFYLASQYFSYASQLQRYVSRYNADNGKISNDLKDYIWSNTNKEIKNSDLKNMANLPSSISTDQILSGTQFVKTGTQFLFFPVYKVSVQPQTLHLSANSQGLMLTVNGKQVSTSDSSNYATALSGLFPGSYTVGATGYISNQSVNLKQHVTATSGSATTAFDLTFISFNLYSNVTNGAVYVGDSQIGTLSNGQYKFVNVPVVGNGLLQVKKDFPSGTVKTQSLAVSSITDGQSVYLNWNQEMTTNAATGLIKAAFSDFGDYASNSTIDNDVSQNFSGGENNSFFQAIKTNIDHNLNSATRNAQSISFSNVNVTGIKQTDVNNYVVTFDVKYDFYYSSSTDSTNQTYGDLYQTFAMAVNVQYNAGNNGASSDNSDTSNSGSTSGTVGDSSSNFIIESQSGTSTVLNTQDEVSKNGDSGN